MENKKRNIEKIEPKLGLSHAKLIFNMTGKFKIQLATGQVKITDYFRCSQKSAECFLDLLSKDEYVRKNIQTNKNISRIQKVAVTANTVHRNNSTVTTIDIKKAEKSIVSKFKKFFKT